MEGATPFLIPPCTFFEQSLGWSGRLQGLLPSVIRVASAHDDAKQQSMAFQKVLGVIAYTQSICTSLTY